MKRIITLSVILLVTQLGFAKKASLFTYDRAKVELSMATVNVVDRFLENHPMDLDALLADNEVLKTLADEAQMPVPAFSDTLKSWAFWGNFALTAGGMFLISIFGVGCGLVGILVVYLITNDREQTLNSLYGCIAGGVVGAGCLIALYGALSAGSASAY